MSYEDWAAEQIAAIVKFFKLDKEDGRYNDVRPEELPEV